MHEVWAKVAWAAIDTAVRGNLSIEGIFDGLPFDAASIRRLRRVAWSDYCILVERIETRAGGSEALAKLLEAEYHESFAEARAFVAAFVSPKALLRTASLATSVLFPPIEQSFFDAGPDRVRVEMRLVAGARPSATFFRGTVGTLAGATRHLGAPSARVEAEVSDHHGIYLLHLPPSRTLLQRADLRDRSLPRLALRLMLGVEEDGSPVMTTVGDVETHDLAARLEAAVAVWDLTRRQRDVLGVLARGRSNKEIAAELGCAENTVELHVTQLLRRGGAASRAQLIARFWSEL